MTLRAEYKKKVTSLMRKFKLRELRTLLSIAFPMISLEKVNELLDRLRYPLALPAVIEVIVHIYEEKTPSIDECDRTLCLLYALDVSLHRTHQWEAATLNNQVSELPDKLSDLDRAIEKAFRARALNANVESVFHNDIIWTVIAERIILKKGGVKLGPPRFFAFNPSVDAPHVLFSPKSMEKDLHLQIYIESLGYSDYELMHYEGKNAIDMINCIERNYSEDRALVEIPQFQPGGVVMTGVDGLVDYSQAEERSNFANMVFNGLSCHQYITVECEELCIDRPPNASSTINEFYSTMEFRTRGSKNSSVEDMFKIMVSMGAVHFPLPDYIANINRISSNSVSTKPF